MSLLLFLVFFVFSHSRIRHFAHFVCVCVEELYVVQSKGQASEQDSHHITFLLEEKPELAVLSCANVFVQPATAVHAHVGELLLALTHCHDPFLDGILDHEFLDDDIALLADAVHAIDGLRHHLGVELWLHDVDAACASQVEAETTSSEG